MRRSAVALELAASGLLDPATSLLLAGAAHDARAAGEPNELAESDLTRALRAALGQPGFRAALAELGRGDELLAELEAAAHQVFLARRFYNDAVAVTRAARRRWLVRAAQAGRGRAAAGVLRDRRFARDRGSGGQRGRHAPLHQRRGRARAGGLTRGRSGRGRPGSGPVSAYHGGEPA